MRKLAYNSCQVPPRYQVKPQTFSMESPVIAGGGSADIRKGILDGRMVAVKSLRPCPQTGPRSDVQKVCAAPIYSFREPPINVTFNPALLQGIHPLDERLSPQPLAAHRR